MVFPVKKFKAALAANADKEVTNPDGLCGFWARWGFEAANRNADDAEANGKVIGYDLAVAELCPEVNTGKILPAWKAGFNAAQNEFKTLLVEQRKELEKKLKNSDDYQAETLKEFYLQEFGKEPDKEKVLTDFWYERARIYERWLNELIVLLEEGLK